jgi:uncharacterized protein (TIGR03086 family)
MTSGPVDRLATALEGTERLVAAVRDEQWAAPTPCAEWDVRALVGHLVGGNRMFARILDGEALADARPAQGTDVLGNDPVAAYQSAADLVVAAFGRPGVLDQVVAVPFGSVPGIVALHLRITEVLVHGWDLARATGQEARFPDDLVEQELEFSRGALPKVPPARSPFAPPQPAPDDAPPIDRLAACLGRHVTATPSHGAG